MFLMIQGKIVGVAPTKMMHTIGKNTRAVSVEKSNGRGKNKKEGYT